MFGEVGAKELGCYSYRKGHTLEMNPFRTGTAEFKDFVAGWKAEGKKVTRTAKYAYRQAKKARPN